MHVLGLVLFWLIFGVGVFVVVLLSLALIVDALIPNTYAGAASYRRDERMN